MGALAERRALLRRARRWTLRRSRRSRAHRRGTSTTSRSPTTPAEIAADNAVIASVYARTAGLSDVSLRQRPGLIRDGPERQRDPGATQYFLSGLSKYDNGHAAQHRIQQAIVRSNLTQTVPAQASSARPISSTPTAWTGAASRATTTTASARTTCSRTRRSSST